MPETTTTPAPDESEPPIPPRYWWLKRILLAAGVLVVGLVVLRLWWGWEASRRLEAKIAEYRAAGQPVTIEDFQLPPVPDDENAAYFLMQAASALVPPASDGEKDLTYLQDLYPYPKLIAEHAAEVGRWLNANGEVFELIDVARSKSRTDWQLRLTSPVINVLLPQLAPQRQLAKLCCTRVLYQHYQVDDAAAIDTIGDIGMIGETLGELRGFIIAHIVVLAIDELAVDSIELITPTLMVHVPDMPGPAEGHGVRAENVRALIDQLLNEEPLQKSWRWALCGERMMQLDAVGLVMRSPGILAPGGRRNAPPGVGWLFKPAMQLDAVLMMEMTTSTMQAGLAADYQSASALLCEYPSFADDLERYVHLLSQMLLPSFERALQLRFRAVAMRRMAAAALAIRLYELDHGHRPETLRQLVPHYLLALPSDPFASDGREIGYAPGTTQPVLYSIGVDGVDDGGAFNLTPGGDVDQEAKDLVFFLNGDRPGTPQEELSTEPIDTQAEEDDPDVHAEEG